MVEAKVRDDGFDDRYQVTQAGMKISDVIDQLRGKAEARIAERLFLKCVNLSMIGQQAGSVAVKALDAPPPSVTIIGAPVAETTTPAPKAREKKPKAEPEPVRVVTADEMEMELNTHKAAGAAVLLTLDEPEKQHMFGELWDDLTNAKTATNVKAAGVAISATGDMFSDEQLQPLRDWYSFRMDCVTGKVVKA